MKEIKIFIDGNYVATSSGQTFEKRTPIDNSMVGLVYEAAQPEVDAAVAAARAALSGPMGDDAGQRPGQAPRRRRR